MDETLKRKLVVVGDGGCGKTCLLTVFANNEFPEEHVPTIFDTYIKSVTFGKTHFSLVLSDTAGEEDYDRLRPLSYSNSDVVLICFAIDNPDSLCNVKLKWFPEIRHFLRYVPYILVGTKVDRRDRIPEKCVNYEEGLKVSKQIRANAYMECSAKFCSGIRPIFEEASLLALKPRKKAYLRECTFM
ncbi:ras-like GTP-binding protein rhoA [Euwallacea similis]|uniref:ras-like GTP-binding protein rhoA n=1 Tax=Euwallacea similis TaxID=1736056 RepID=UPI0034502356